MAQHLGGQVEPMCMQQQVHTNGMILGFQLSIPMKACATKH